MADSGSGGAWVLLAVAVIGIAAYTDGRTTTGTTTRTTDAQTTTGSIFQATDCEATGVERLSLGDRGRTVSQLQSCLRGLGYDDSAVDGVFGVRTRRAVVGFQRDEGLVPDGIVGPDTRDALAAAG